MRKVTIQTKTGPREVVVFYTNGPWAVTPSVDTGMRGFVVTHTPTGRQAWPLSRGADTSMPEASAMADELAKLWADEGEAIPTSVRRSIMTLVGGDR